MDRGPTYLPQSCFPALRTLCATASINPTVVKVPPTIAQMLVTKSYHVPSRAGADQALASGL